MTNVLRDPVMRHGIVKGQNEEFIVSGDLKAAYEVLKEMFDPKTANKSGPIRPLTREEIDLEKNKPIQNTLNELPPTHIA